MKITPLQKKRILYADFRKDLLLNPVSSDLARVTNEEAVKDSIVNLLLTNRGERFFRPNLGSDIQTMLFENVSPLTILSIEEMVKSTISNYEPRANVIDVSVKANEDYNDITVTIVFNVVNSETPITLTKTLTRVR